MVIPAMKPSDLLLVNRIELLCTLLCVAQPFQFFEYIILCCADPSSWCSVSCVGHKASTPSARHC